MMRGKIQTLESFASRSVLSSTSFSLLPLSQANIFALKISLSPLMLLAFKKNLLKIWILNSIPEGVGCELWAEYVRL